MLKLLLLKDMITEFILGKDESINTSKKFDLKEKNGTL